MRKLFVITFLFCLPLFLSAQKQNDSTKDGRYFHYNDSARLVFTGKYLHGLRHGIFKEYDSAGFLLRKSRYKKGKLRWSQLYQNGKITEVTDRRGNVKKRKNCGC